MKSVSTGFGLCVLGLGIAAWPVLDRLMPHANASGVPIAASAIAAAVAAQDPPAPTIVWYGVSPQTDSQNTSTMGALFRAWSDGRIEYRVFRTNPTWYEPCSLYPGNPDCGWRTLSDPAQGYAARSDLNFDQLVNGADLAALLNDWGDAPRHVIPPSDCPLNLVNP